MREPTSGSSRACPSTKRCAAPSPCSAAWSSSPTPATASLAAQPATAPSSCANCSPSIVQRTALVPDGRSRGRARRLCRWRRQRTQPRPRRQARPLVWSTRCPSPRRRRPGRGPAGSGQSSGAARSTWAKPPCSKSARSRVVVSEHVGIGGNHPVVYRRFGIEPATAQMVVLKTASNFQYYRGSLPPSSVSIHLARPCRTWKSSHWRPLRAPSIRSTRWTTWRPTGRPTLPAFPRRGERVCAGISSYSHASDTGRQT